METYTKAASGMLASPESGYFRGYAARFLNIDRQGDIILPGAFTSAIKEFQADGGMVLADHMNKTSAVIGTLMDASEDRQGLLVDVALSATKSGQEVRQLLKEKALRKMSISFLAKRPTRIPDAQIRDIWAKYNYKPSEAQKQLAKSGANLISEVAEVLEVSIVPIPANPGAEIIAVKSFDEPQAPPSTPPDGGIVVAGQLLDFTQLMKRAELADRVISQVIAERRKNKGV